MSTEFKSLNSFYEFKTSVSNGNHFLFDDESTSFLETVAITGKSRILNVKANTDMFRSQKGYDLEPCTQYDPTTGEEFHVDDFVIPLCEKRMRPRELLAVEGRVNTKGTPVFYCANDLTTSIMETRPWVNSYVSVARFNFSKDLTVVDCTKNSQDQSFILNEWTHYLNKTTPSAEEKEKRVWHDIDHAFSQPITRNDEEWDYLPTQILAELFKKEGYDGIAYKSSVGKGHNLAIFDTELPVFKDSKMSYITEINIHYKIDERF